MKAAFLDFATVASADLDVTPLQSATAAFETWDSTAAADVAGRIADCEFVYVNKVRMTRAVIEGARHLRFIGIVATGVDNVDLDAAAERGVAVANIRGYCTRSVVEHVFAMLLMLTRSLGSYAASVRRGAWREAKNFCLLDHPIRELSAMTIGIVGFGELGRAVANAASAFGMRVLVSARPGETAAAGRTDFGNVLRTADVVSLHCPLTPQTSGLIGARELGLMKPGGILINTARGGLVDSAALVSALRGGTIGGAAIDVLGQEPPVDGDPLLDYRGDNLVLTPHIAWATVEARQRAIAETAANVAAFLAGQTRNRIV